MGITRAHNCQTESLKKEDAELLDPLNARGGPLKLYNVATSYISICWDLVDTGSLVLFLTSKLGRQRPHFLGDNANVTAM
jgi:hypothetical protein